MAGWFAHGIAAGIRTTRFPRRREEAAGVTPGLPQSTRIGARAGEVASRCPTGALVAQGEEVAFDARRCIHCYRCVRGVETPVRWSEGYEWTLRPEGDRAGLRQAGVGEVAERPFAFEPPFRRSINILVMDAGDCGACLSEVQPAPPRILHHPDPSERGSPPRGRTRNRRHAPSAPFGLGGDADPEADPRRRRVRAHRIDLRAELRERGRGGRSPSGRS